MKRLNCRQVKRLVVSFERGEWPAALRGAIEAHLADCQSCSRDLALMGLVREALWRTPRHRAPSDFTASVMRRIGEVELDRSRAQAHRFPAPVAYRAVLIAAIVALFVSAALLYVGHQNHALPQAAFEVAAVPYGEASLVEQLVMYHEQAAAYQVGVDAGILMARAGP